MTAIKRIGILGGGQLSQMLCEAAQSLRLEPIPFCFSKDDPAALVAKEFVVGNISDEKEARLFFEATDIATFESDFLPFELLSKFSSHRFVPGLACIERLRDKIYQKELLKELGVPSPEHVKFVGGEIGAWLKCAVKQFQGDAVFKWSREGYDGKGVFLFSGDFQKAEAFCREALNRGVEIFAERKILFKRELALVSAFSLRGEMAFYPLVISEQRSGICKRVVGPAASFGVDAALEVRAREYAEKIAHKIKLYGVFAIELFETPSGECLVNELAPRVHNSGHFSQDATETSQFENHLRAILGEALGSTKSTSAFSMLNLLAPAGNPKSNLSELNMPPGFHFHWYGKSESRERRKMGHINLVCSSPAELNKKLSGMDALDREWLSKFSTER